ncbi:conserved oligomeric Golgi complex subunit 6 [Tissierella carlieri]|uniref:Conserved oligomeric Golgi complex subunit 6 n=1 Tax=Tissierella carlieri TaxID=689904 RepID=A0ABT1SG28_9FIRM|nr:conserved oligomeric Golgi complex subunit 6 [Tissierella carlieri]MCQ4925312.1 conserved oligomeric Golgi complex subunit 6 [Tissierella carlieri]
MTDRELLELIAAQVGTLTKDVSEIKEEFKDVNERLDRIENKLDDLESANAANHVATKTRLNKISSDLDFLTHKEFQTEKEIYDIKQRLIKQRRNTR